MEVKRGLNPEKVEKKKPLTNADKFRAISEEATAYNLRDDLVGEMAMKYLQKEAERISREIENKKKSGK